MKNQKTKSKKQQKQIDAMIVLLMEDQVNWQAVETLAKQAGGSFLCPLLKEKQVNWQAIETLAKQVENIEGRQI